MRMNGNTTDYRLYTYMEKKKGENYYIQLIVKYINFSKLNSFMELNFVVSFFFVVRHACKRKAYN